MNLLYPFKRIYSSREDVNTLLRFWGMQYLGALLTGVIQSGFAETEYFSFAIDTSTNSTSELSALSLSTVPSTDWVPLIVNTASR